MGTCALPDIYALTPRACGPRASGIHIRQSTRAHVITYTYKHTIINQVALHPCEAISLVRAYCFCIGWDKAKKQSGYAKLVAKLHKS